MGVVPSAKGLRASPRQAWLAANGRGLSLGGTLERPLSVVQEGWRDVQLFWRSPFSSPFSLSRGRRDRTVPVACQLEEPGTTVALSGEVIS